jgi:hypothetical protein
VPRYALLSWKIFEDVLDGLLGSERRGDAESVGVFLFVL